MKCLHFSILNPICGWDGEPSNKHTSSHLSAHWPYSEHFNLIKILEKGIRFGVCSVNVNLCKYNKDEIYWVWSIGCKASDWKLLQKPKMFVKNVRKADTRGWRAKDKINNFGFLPSSLIYEHEPVATRRVEEEEKFHMPETNNEWLARIINLPSFEELNMVRIFLKITFWRFLLKIASFEKLMWIYFN